jgi:hypothetical protein
MRGNFQFRSQRILISLKRLLVVSKDHFGRKIDQKFKKSNEKFLPRKACESQFHGFRISKQEVPKPWKPL